MKTIVIEAGKCPKCGQPMPAGALAGLCPACLLAQGLATEEAGMPKGRHFEPPPLEEVTKLFPQLEIQSLLGAGGMGAVYKARQPALDRVVALKILPGKGAGGANFEERFNREARALARLNHPHIVAVFEFGQVGGEGGLHFFIMEFVDGANLRQLEQAARLTPREALQIIPQICDALQYAHDEGVVHRDIKPENVLVDRKGRVKIADFGLAKILGSDMESSRLTVEGQVMGTPHYMAPEQIEKPLSVDHRADIYSLGVVLYEMLTGDLPLGKFAPPSRKYQLDVRLDDVVLRALENDPARRYQHASEVKSQVENIASSPAPAAPAPPAPDPDLIRWAGFPVVAECGGVRKVNRKEALKMFGLFFALLTVAFGLVSIIHGQNLFGWLGIAGSTSLWLRLLVAVLGTAFGVWRALRTKAAATLPPQTPQGTVILPPEIFSRKALVGVAWIPFALFAFLGTFGLVAFEASAVRHGPYWWQILLAVVTLPLGFTAPFGTTVLGWMAVADIRRARGRIGGLPLAVFDGLFFSLLALDVFLCLGLIKMFYWFTATQIQQPFTNPPREVVIFGAILICALVDFLIIQRVWRAVRLDGNPPGASRDWWWNRKPGGVAIGLACVAVIVVTVWRREPGAFAHALLKVAMTDKTTGTQVASVGPRGKVELLAVSDAGTAPNEWWLPNGTPVPDTLYEFEKIGNVKFDGWTNKDFVVRWRDLPADAEGPYVEFEPNGASSNGGESWRDGKKFWGDRAVRAAFPPAATEATIRVGFDLTEWQTVSIHDPNGNGRNLKTPPSAPNFPARVHEVGETEGHVHVTMLMAKETRDWKIRVIAVDLSNQEHTSGRGTATPTGKTLVQTYEFRYVPLSQVREFRVQVRPVHWVEFRGVALVPRDRSAVGKSSRPFKPTAFSEVKEVQITRFFDFDTGRAPVVPPEMDSTDDGHLLQSKWAREQGADVSASYTQLFPNGNLEIADLAPSEWTTQRPEKLTERLERSLYVPSLLPTGRYGSWSFPLHYAFRTRDKGLGIMELVRSEPKRTNITVRYKMIEHAHFE